MLIEHILKASLDRECKITIIYEKEKVITKRNIQVMEIGEDSIKAFCHLRKQMRIFRTENILSAAFYKEAAARSFH